jgi:hypothetical protein
MSMISNQEIGGFRGFVGPQLGIVFVGDRSEFGARYAPIAQDFNFRPENSLLGVSLTRKLDWKKGEDHYKLTGEFNNTYYKSPSSGAETKFQTFGIQFEIPID